MNPPDQIPTAKVATQRPAPRFKGPRRRRSGILIVEDNGVIALDIAELLADWGYQLAGVVHSPADALRVLANRRADLVLLDVDFHGCKSGLQAALKIQRNFGVPVVFVTGCSSESLGPVLTMTEPFGLVPKPINPHYLAAVVLRALRGPGGL